MKKNSVLVKHLTIYQFIFIFNFISIYCFAQSGNRFIGMHMSKAEKQTDSAVIVFANNLCVKIIHVGATWGNPGDNIEGSGYPGPGDIANIYIDKVRIPAGVTARCATINLSDGSNDAQVVFNASTAVLICTGVVTIGDPAGKKGILESG